MAALLFPLRAYPVEKHRSSPHGAELEPNVEGEGGEDPCYVELEEAAVQNGIQRRQAPPCQSCVTQELRLIRVRRSTYQVR